jgi:hypothetical protein
MNVKYIASSRDNAAFEKDMADFLAEAGGHDGCACHWLHPVSPGAIE